MGRKILLAEDEKSIRDLLLLNLEIEGYDVDVVGDGKSAINIFKSNHYDIVVLDVMMPEIDGFSVCEKIRKIDKEVPILFLTARGQDEDKIEGLKIAICGDILHSRVARSNIYLLNMLGAEVNIIAPTNLKIGRAHV